MSTDRSKDLPPIVGVRGHIVPPICGERLQLDLLGFCPSFFGTVRSKTGLPAPRFSWAHDQPLSSAVHRVPLHAAVGTWSLPLDQRARQTRSPCRA